MPPAFRCSLISSLCVICASLVQKRCEVLVSVDRYVPVTASELVPSFTCGVCYRVGAALSPSELQPTKLSGHAMPLRQKSGERGGGHKRMGEGSTLSSHWILDVTSPPLSVLQRAPALDGTYVIHRGGQSARWQPAPAPGGSPQPTLRPNVRLETGWHACTHALACVAYDPGHASWRNRRIRRGRPPSSPHPLATARPSKCQWA